MGLTAGPVPPRVDASVKAGLLELVDHAAEAGWSTRAAAGQLGLDDTRAWRWLARRDAGRLADASSGPPEAAHRLLDWERAAVVKLADEWGETDRSHRKLAHRGSRLEIVHASESTVRRVLDAEGLRLPGREHPEPTPRAPWPEWVRWEPVCIWAYDFTHFPRAKRAVVAVLDVVSRKWISTVCSAEESSTQVEVAFTAALETEGLDGILDASLRAELAAGHAARAEADPRMPVLLAISDNGPQMNSHSTRAFMTAAAIATRFGRPGVPNDQAWIESLFGHVKSEWPHLTKIRDPAELERELDRLREQYNTVRLHAGIGYVTPNDEHEGRGEAYRQARRDGLAHARETRIAYRRNDRGDNQ